LQIEKQSNKNTSMYKLYYFTAIRSIVKNCPSLKFCFDLPLYYTAASQTSNSNISSKFETEFENILGYESVFQMASFDEKKPEPKPSCYCPFKCFATTGGRFRLPFWLDMTRQKKR
jgi:hypothetical protein